MLFKNRLKAKFQSQPPNLIIEKVCLVAKQEQFKIRFLVKSALRFSAWFCDCLVSGDDFIHRHCFQDLNSPINAVPVNVSQAG